MTNDRDHFGDRHPLVTFIYFASVMLFSMISFNPACLTATLVCASVYFMTVRGAAALLKRLVLITPVFIVTALINPTFNHRGATILAYFPTGNPLTAESILFGLAAGEMLAAALMWLDCFNRIMTSDKTVYLFGRILPSLALLISVTFRFIPRMTLRFKQIYSAQKQFAPENGGFLSKLRLTLGALSALVSYMLESSIEISDSMQSRGCGFGKRTQYSLFRFGSRDTADMAIIIFLSAATGTAFAKGLFKFDYYPLISGVKAVPWAYICFTLLCLVPTAINIKEEIKWHLLRSRI